MWFVDKTDKEKKQRVRVLSLEPTEETNQSLRKDITGLLKVKFKTDYGVKNYEDLDEDDFEEIVGPNDEFIENESDTALSTEEEIELTEDMFDENGKLSLEKINPDLYKNVVTDEMLEGENETNYVYERTRKPKTPDFAFIGDYYVPKYLLNKHNITNDCKVNARVIYAGDKWKITDVQKI